VYKTYVTAFAAVDLKGSLPQVGVFLGPLLRLYGISRLIS
jgi:hypothetical protein